MPLEMASVQFFIAEPGVGARYFIGKVENAGGDMAWPCVWAEDRHDAVEKILQEDPFGGERFEIREIHD